MDTAAGIAPRSGKVRGAFMVLLLLHMVAGGISFDAHEGAADMIKEQTITLPAASTSGTLSIEAALQNRRSVRGYNDRQISLEEIAQLLWATQGITEPSRGLRTAPSAGATFPLEIHVVAAGISGLSPGVYRYHPREHKLESVISGDRRPDLFEAALRQPAIMHAPAIIVITAIPERTEARYGQRALRYIHMEAGHAAQNLSLQAVALDIGTVVIGAFQDAGVAEALGLRPGELPLYLAPVGKF